MPKKKGPPPVTGIAANIPDPGEIKNDIPALLDNLGGKCVLQAKGISLSKCDAALFLWDQAMKNKKAGEELEGGSLARSAAKALEEGTGLDRAASAGLLAHITKTSDEARPFMQAAGVATALCQVLADPEASATAVANAAAALQNMAQNPEVRRKMAAELDFRALVETARPNPSAEAAARESRQLNVARAEAAGVLALCMDPDRNPDHAFVRRAVIEADGLTAFVALLRAGRLAGMEAAAWCIAHVSYEEDAKDAVLADAGCLLLVSNALRSKEVTSLKLKAAAAACVSRLTASGAPESDVEKNLRAQASQLRWQVSQPGAKELSNYEEQRLLLSETTSRLNGIMLGAMAATRKDAARLTEARVRAVIAMDVLGPLVGLLRAPTEEQLEAAGLAGKGGKKGKGKKKKGKAPPLPPWMLECYVHASTALRRLSFDAGVVAELRETAAAANLVPLLEHADHRVRRNAESTLRNLGTAANAAQLKLAKAPERHFRRPLPGVSLTDLDLPPRVQAKLDAMLPGLAASRPATAIGTIRRRQALDSAPPSSMVGLYAPRAQTPGGATGAPRPASIQ